MPGAIRLWLLRCYARVFHRVTITGVEYYTLPGEHAIVVPNHVSFADGPLLAAFLPGNKAFVIDAQIAKRWWVRPFLVRMPVIRVDPRHAFAIRTMIQEVKVGTRLVLFPEGRISETAGLMKVYDGAGMIADKAAAKLVPVRIEGTQFTLLSYLGGKLRRRWLPRISITVLPSLSLSLDPALLGRPRRHAAAPGTLEPRERSWYDTGDIVQVDDQGFVWIKDRASRFAKIGGEMIATNVGEALADGIWPDATNAVVALPDPRRGERLMLVTSRVTATIEPLLDAARVQGIPEIMVPRTLIYLERLPRLGTGKIDYPAVRRLAEAERIIA